MKKRCPDLNCNSHKIKSPDLKPIVRKGSFFRKSDSRFIQRYYCKICRTHFSGSSGKLSMHQKARRITPPLRKLLNSGVSQRRAALILGVNPKTIVRRFRYLAEVERKRHAKWVDLSYKKQKLNYIQFDDLETAEHTKCKPLSVAIAIDPNTRKILNFKVNQMPAKGHLAKLSIQKYGYRKDERAKGWEEMFKELVPLVTPQALFFSDENPHYPRYLKKYHPYCIHKTTKGGRGSVAGQGELKKLKFDPLFALNHTCAMLRANLNRLFRRTWCLSKNKQGLIDHISLYVSYHNRVLTEELAKAQG